MESNAYILGTEQAELHRLGIQHQIWSSEARQAWKTAEFGFGQTILDLGSGPGFCTFELAYMVGQNGKVIAVDKSQAFINFINEQNKQQQLNIETQCTSFEDIKLKENSIDRVYSRWALSWASNTDKIINDIVTSLKIGGVVAMQEYYDWSTLQIEPNLPNLTKGMQKALQSFLDTDSDINIGRRLPAMLSKAGLELLQIRPLSKCVAFNSIEWQWPRTFFNIYLPKLGEMGYLTKNEVALAFSDFDELEKIEGASILCPHMLEVIAVKTK